MTPGIEVKPRGGFLDPRILYSGSRLFVLILLGIALTLASSVFLTGTNALNVLRVASLLVILGIGETIVILTAGIDLSIGAVLTLSSVIAAAGTQGRRAAPSGPGLRPGRRSRSRSPQRADGGRR